MRNELFALVGASLLAIVLGSGAAAQEIPWELIEGSEGLKGIYREVAAEVLVTAKCYGGCDDTIAGCLSADPNDPIARRLAAFVVRRVKTDKDVEELVQEIVRRIVNTAQPDRIILFGSAATGQMSRDSDVDLLILEAKPANTREKSVRVRQALRGLGYPFDVIVMATERFEESKNVIGGIAYPANKYGKVIYEVA